MLPRVPLRLLSLALLLLLSATATAPPAEARSAGAAVLGALGRSACARAGAASAGEETPRARAVREVVDRACARAARAPRPASDRIVGTAPSATPVRLAATTAPDGTLLARERLLTGFGIGVDLVAYASEGLQVGGLLCYPHDGRPHSTVVHLHGGFGGLFLSPDGDMVGTCVDWAMKHGRTALAPSYRGQDGGDGELEICLGEAADAANAVVLARGLEVTDPDRVAMVGGSVGGCVALRAAPRVPDLRAVVAFVPPVDWKGLVDFHRHRWSEVRETDCQGEPRVHDVGGPALADAVDRVICGAPGCPDAAYAARSPLPGVRGQRAPTLVVSASADNVVPTQQELLWSLLRQAEGHPVALHVMDRCDPPFPPPLAFDVHLHVVGGTHSLGPNAVSSGLLFLMNALDAPSAPGAGPLEP